MEFSFQRRAIILVFPRIHSSHGRAPHQSLEASTPLLSTPLHLCAFPILTSGTLPLPHPSFLLYSTDLSLFF